jgi:hypothetical protein
MRQRIFLMLRFGIPKVFTARLKRQIKIRFSFQPPLTLPDIVYLFELIGVVAKYRPAGR